MVDDGKEKKSDQNVEGSSRTRENIDKRPTALKIAHTKYVTEVDWSLKTMGTDLASGQRTAAVQDIKRAIDLDFNLERAIWWMPETPIQDPTLA
jgi:hypothetical protein